MDIPGSRAGFTVPAASRCIGKWSDIIVRHTGYADAAMKARKRERDWNILLEEVASRPNDAFVTFNLGMIAFERKQWPESLKYFAVSFVTIPNTTAMESLHRKLFAMLAWTHQLVGNLQASLRTCNDGLAVYAHDAELLFRKAVALRYLGRTAEAEKCWRTILGLKRPAKFCSVDQGIFGHLTRRNLAIIARERGDKGELRMQWEAILAECPGDPDALRHLELRTA